MSLEYLIDLSRRTGDRLIVHNPMEDSDIVIMDVDEYEMLLLDKQDVRELSEGQLLDQINRDIAVWRANKELEDEYIEEPRELDRLTESAWHSAKSILDRECRQDDFLFDECEDKGVEEDLSDFGLLDDSLREGEYAEDNNEILTKVPYKPDLEVNLSDWQEEPVLEDDPVFYEEPV